jgi:hypothetical protein
VVPLSRPFAGTTLGESLGRFWASDDRFGGVLWPLRGYGNRRRRHGRRLAVAIPNLCPDYHWVRLRSRRSGSEFSSAPQHSRCCKKVPRSLLSSHLYGTSSQHPAVHHPRTTRIDSRRPCPCPRRRSVCRAAPACGCYVCQVQLDSMSGNGEPIISQR